MKLIFISLALSISALLSAAPAKTNKWMRRDLGAVKNLQFLKIAWLDG